MDAITRSTEQQRINRELAESLMGKRVIFETERGLREGVVVGHCQYGGGSMAWRLSVDVRYRGGTYPCRVEDIAY